MLFPFQIAFSWLLHGGDPNRLLSGVILQVSVKCCCLFFGWGGRGYRNDVFNYKKEDRAMECFGIQLHLGDAKAGTRYQYAVHPHEVLQLVTTLDQGTDFGGNQTIQTVFIILGGDVPYSNALFGLVSY